MAIADNNLTSNSMFRWGGKDTRIGCHVCGGARVEEPVVAATARIVDRHPVQGGVEAGWDGGGVAGVVGGIGGRRCRERRHRLGWADTGSGAEDAGPPGRHGPRLDDAMPWVRRRPPLRRRRALRLLSLLHPTATSGMPVWDTLATLRYSGCRAL